MKAKKIDHICFVVKDLTKARRMYEEHLGFELCCQYIAPSEKIKVARYYVGEVAVELTEPYGEGEVSQFLERHGEGFFLISYRVDNVEKGLAELAGKGEKTIDKRPRWIFGNFMHSFNHPADGVAFLRRYWMGSLTVISFIF